MTHDLDDLLGQLATLRVDRALDTLEPCVWGRIEALRSERVVSQIRLGVVAVALATGLTVGGLGAVSTPSTPTEMAIFTPQDGLSPLMNLDTGP